MLEDNLALPHLFLSRKLRFRIFWEWVGGRQGWGDLGLELKTEATQDIINRK